MVMKKILYSLVWVLAIHTLLTACKEENPQLANPPVASDVTFTYEYDTENPNIVHFTNTSEGFKAIWDFGNGQSSGENDASIGYPVKGDYTVKLTILTAGGAATSSQIVEIENTNPLMLDIPEYNMLTGGANDADGKTWMVDKDIPGHLGVGPNGGAGPDWYSAGPNEKTGKHLYDDEMTFKLDGFSFSHVVNDYFYANGGYGTLPGALPEPGGGADYIVPWTPKVSTWNVTNNGDGTYGLTVSNGEFIGYYQGATAYTILSLSNDEMHIRAKDPNAGDPCCTWYQRLIRKGYVRPTDPEEPMEYKIEDIEDNFEGSSDVEYANDAGGIITVGYDNPAPVGINTSGNVALYVKTNGAGSQFANVQIRLDYKMDIRVRNKFKLKVFIPGYNDYTTTGGEPWQSYNTLQKQVSIKLQNRELGGNAYTTQAEVKHTNLETDKWLELEFDFSGVSTREDFDQIVIQLGGEAIHTGGIFFIDDLELLD